MNNFFSSVSLRLLRKQTDEAWLRRHLRAAPRWREGHRALAVWLLKQEAARDGKKNRRALSTVRASADAIECLGGDAAEVVFFRAMVRFYEQRFEEALSLFEAVVAAEKKSRFQIQALEYAGAAAMTLGRRQDAKRLYSEIPREEWNLEIETAVKCLELPV